VTHFHKQQVQEGYPFMPRKKKKPRRLRKKHRKQKQTRDPIAESRNRLIEKMESHPLGPEIKWDDGSAEEKMSEVIFQYAEPLLEITHNKEQEKKVLAIAMILWNYALMPGELKSEQLIEIEKLFGIPDGEKNGDALKDVVDFMM
jgi:hypothetical protein